MKRISGAACFILMLSGILFEGGCGSARRGEPFTDLQLTEAQFRGRTMFMEHCHQCHPGGSAGLGPALNNKPLPAWAIRMQVRHGFGVMPSFPEDKISNEDLDLVVDFLKALRSEQNRL